MEQAQQRATIKHQIKSIGGAVLFEAEIPGDTPSGLIVRAALEQATEKRAYLGGADLRGANLGDADLRGADLRGADLGGANLRGADPRGADLGGADLRGANLGDANLRGANLRGADLGDAYLRGADLGGADLRGAYLGDAYLRGKKLVGSRPVLQIGPIGSRADYFLALITDAGVIVKAGCFEGSIEEFEEQCADTHGSNKHAQEYAAALVLIRTHAELWTPEKVKTSELEAA